MPKPPDAEITSIGGGLVGRAAGCKAQGISGSAGMERIRVEHAAKEAEQVYGIYYVVNPRFAKSTDGNGRPA